MAVAPHLAFPLRMVAGAFQTVEQLDPAHAQQCADVILRTEPGTFDHQSDLGLRDLVGQAPPLGHVIGEALERFEPRRRMLIDEDLTELAQRIVREHVQQAPEAEG